jgi:hypothetical protein
VRATGRFATGRDRRRIRYRPSRVPVGSRRQQACFASALDIFIGTSDALRVGLLVRGCLTLSQIAVTTTVFWIHNTCPGLIGSDHLGVHRRWHLLLLPRRTAVATTTQPATAVHGCSCNRNAGHACCTDAASSTTISFIASTIHTRGAVAIGQWQGSPSLPLSPSLSLSLTCA